MFRILIIGLSLFLTSCTLPGTQDEAATVEESTIPWEDNAVSMRVPRTWVIQTGSTLPDAKRGSIVSAWVSPEMKSGYANNLLILSDTLENPMTSSRYSTLNNLQTRKNYLEYGTVKETDIVFGDSETSRLFVFEAKYNETTPRMKFIQTARVCGTRVYLLHFTLALDKKSDSYSEVLETFTCR